MWGKDERKGEEERFAPKMVRHLRLEAALGR
jgi:hypothetical protein